MSEIVRCCLCKYWKADRRLGSCSNPKVLGGYSKAIRDAVPDDGMLVENDEGWGFETGPDFGCVNGEERE